jgi:hypothetical protein
MIVPDHTVGVPAKAIDIIDAQYAKQEDYQKKESKSKRQFRF